MQELHNCFCQRTAAPRVSSPVLATALHSPSLKWRSPLPKYHTRLPGRYPRSPKHARLANPSPPQNRPTTRSPSVPTARPQSVPTTRPPPGPTARATLPTSLAPPTQSRSF
eukprot:3833861-Pleurochrysis_carterae.AAC.2